MSDGSRHSMAFVEESTYGETPATPTFTPIRNNGTTLALGKNTKQPNEIRNDRMIADYRHGAYRVGGNINFDLSYGSFDTLLEAVLCGTWAADTPVAGTDQLKAGTTRRSFTIERLFADIQSVDSPYHRFRGCEFSRLQLQVNADDIITGVFSVLGAGMATDTAAITGSTYNPASTTRPLDSFTGILNEGGAQIAVITEIALTLENNHNPRYVIGSKETILPSIGRSNLTGQITAFFENSALLNKFINETESSIDFNLPDPAGNNYKFIIPRLKYNGGQPDVQGEGPITLAMPFQALLDNSYNTNLIIERTAA